MDDFVEIKWIPFVEIKWIPLYKLKTKDFVAHDCYFFGVMFPFKSL